jgi:hypothetical protein
MLASRTWPVAALTATLLAAGCDDKKHVSSCSPLISSSTASQTGSPPAQTMFLTDVQAKGGRCVDRITFSFRKQGAALPGYTVHYLPAAQATVEDGSGRKLKIAGKAFLVVRIYPAATAVASGDKLEFTYRGKRLLPTGMRHVKELVKTGDFEAVVTWAIGLDGKRPFKLSGPTSAPGFTVEIG